MEIRMLTKADEFAAFAPLLPDSAVPNDERAIVLGAYAENRESGLFHPAGVLVARMMPEGDLRIGWLYVNPPDRRGRLGSELVGYLAEVAAWQEQVFLITAPFDEAAAQRGVRAMFEYEGFEIQAGGRAYSFTLEQVADLPALEGYETRGEALELLALEAATPRQLSGAGALLEKGNAPVALPLDRAAYAPGSFLCLRAGQVAGVLLVADDGGGLSIPLLHTASPTAVPLLIRGAVRRLQALYPPQTPVRLCAVSGPALALAQKLLPGAEDQAAWVAVMELPIVDADQIAWMEKILEAEDIDGEG